MRSSRSYYLDIFLISFAALLLEIGYTRLISFKLFYYYTYLIIGFALLGIGSGGVVVAVSSSIKRIELGRLMSGGSFVAALAATAGYLVIATIGIDTKAIWSGSAPGTNFARLLVICLALFGNFITVGVMIASLFGRDPQRINRLYFADLMGAGLACALVVPILRTLTPPGCICLGALVLAATGAMRARVQWPAVAYASSALGALLAVGVVRPELLPDPQTDRLKTIAPDTETLFSQWSPVFRIDVTEAPGNPAMHVIHHDGLWGSSLHRFDGNLASLARFDKDERSFPFRTLGRDPARVLIIGAAGGHEILASLYFRAEHVTAVELNPVTVSLLTNTFADFSGRLHENPRVTLVNDEGRSYLARDRSQYDLIFFVAPDSYSAMNAATAGAFVLSESYLYTVEMIVESLSHLTEDGVVCMQFGEFAYDAKPNRTTRYVSTARAALERMGVADPERHILVTTSPSFIPISTILLKRNAFTGEEIGRFLKNVHAVEGSRPRHAWGTRLDDGPVNTVLSLPSAELPRWYAEYKYNVGPIFDDSPFFWHFARFGAVVSGFREQAGIIDLEDSIGERVLLMLLAIAALFAATFLLLPFVMIRDVWRALPRKLESAAFFAALGLGFMFFEISMIQKLTLFLGYPTYSLTVTLMSLLVFTGIGSMTTALYAERRVAALGALLACIVGLTVFYQFALDAVTAALLGAPLLARAAAVVVMLAPLGVCLGAFMPIGLAAVSDLTKYKDEYVAWGWAVNGFFSVIGSVLTTILSMTIGFRAVLLLGLLVYVAAVLLMRRILRPASALLR